MIRPALWLLAALMTAGSCPAKAADIGLAGAPGPALVEAPPPPMAGVGPLAPAHPLLGPPPIRYGCQRIWRCDSTVCEWRRGCWGIYGYVETPYYTSALARRQWERHGLPTPQHVRRYHQ
jgi:hypothetical protein